MNGELMQKNKDIKRQLIGRINRVIGQLNGLKRMLDGESNCVEVITQVSATRAAISQLGVVMVQEYMEQCLTQAIKSKRSKETVYAFNKIMKQMLK